MRAADVERGIVEEDVTRRHGKKRAVCEDCRVERSLESKSGGGGWLGACQDQQACQHGAYSCHRKVLSTEMIFGQQISYGIVVDPWGPFRWWWCNFNEADLAWGGGSYHIGSAARGVEVALRDRLRGPASMPPHHHWHVSGVARSSSSSALATVGSRTHSTAPIALWRPGPAAGLQQHVR